MTFTVTTIVAAYNHMHSVSIDAVVSTTSTTCTTPGTTSGLATTAVTGAAVGTKTAFYHTMDPAAKSVALTNELTEKLTPI